MSANDYRVLISLLCVLQKGCKLVNAGLLVSIRKLAVKVVEIVKIYGLYNVEITLVTVSVIINVLMIGIIILPLVLFVRSGCCGTCT